MNALEFFGTIYLGDRHCTSVEMDGHSEELRIGVNLISRVRGSEWNFYDAEDVENGSLVFEGIKFANFDRSGPIPNDWIDLVEARPLNEEFYEFKLSLGQRGLTSEVHRNNFDYRGQIACDPICDWNADSRMIRRLLRNG